MNKIVSGTVENSIKIKLKQTQLNFSSIKKLPQKKSKTNYSFEENIENSIIKAEVIDLCNSSSESDVKISLKSFEKDDKKTEVTAFNNLQNNCEKNLNIHCADPEVIDLCDESSSDLEDEPENTIKQNGSPKNHKKHRVRRKTVKPIKSKVIHFKSECVQVNPETTCPDKNYNQETYHRKKRPGTIDAEKNECPPYKVIEGTTFAVDAFNFGLIKNVSIYFLTHFHTDHYIGLTKKFSMPIYSSEITVNLIRGFISVDEKLLNILHLNETIEIEGVNVTAIDANHCPGAIMLLFELPDGKGILHTGDFRWSRKMELNPYLNQNNIDLIYLDTTHISNKHIISTQEECISKAISWVREFRNLNEGKKILYVVCTDVIGKENFWLSIAEAFDLKVWTDGKRRKALLIIDNQKILSKLVPIANEADMHVVSHAEAGFRHIDEYFQKFSDSYDMLLSVKPKGLDSIEPEFSGQLNSVSVRYSEHSTHKELREFLRFLLPKRVISTVPSGKNIFRCPKVPVSWHTKELHMPYKRQASILNYVRNKKD